MDAVAMNPSKGLPSLLSSMNESGYKSSGMGRALHEQNIKNNVPRIFELLSKAMEGLCENTSKPVLAACSVIVRSAKLHEDPSVGGSPGTIKADCLLQCQRHLASLLKKAQDTAHMTWVTHFMEDDTASKEAHAIALASIALFSLEHHGLECKQEMGKSGGILAAISAMKMGSGIKIQAKLSLASMLKSYVDQCHKHPEIVQSIVQSDGVSVLLVHIQDNVTDPSKDMLQMRLDIAAVLDACLQSCQRIFGEDDIKASIGQCRSVAWCK